MATITTSVVVQFNVSSTDQNSIFTAEVDGRDEGENGLNAGKTNFYPGDQVYLLLYKSSDVTVDEYLPSAGSLIKQSAQVTIPQTEYLTFADEMEATLSKPATSGWTTKWLGKSLGAVKLNTIKTKVTLATKPSTTHYAGILKVTYNTVAQVYLLKDTLITGEDEYEIMCFFIGHNAAP